MHKDRDLKPAPAFRLWGNHKEIHAFTDTLTYTQTPKGNHSVNTHTDGKKIVKSLEGRTKLRSKCGSREENKKRRKERKERSE